jgi:hypothetical protein
MRRRNATTKIQPRGDDGIFGTYTLIQLILGRSAYSTTEERDAETLASLILTNAER